VQSLKQTGEKINPRITLKGKIEMDKDEITDLIWLQLHKHAQYLLSAIKLDADSVVPCQLAKIMYWQEWQEFVED